MKKVALFLSDIIGTINGSVPNEEKDYLRLVQLLNQIKEQDKVEIIAFSLISSDNHEVVTSWQDKLESYSDGTITFGRQFCDCGYEYHHQFISQEKAIGKTNQIMEYIDTLDEFYDIVSIYYADDIEIYQDMLSLVSEGHSWSKKITYITPTEKKGLSETNEMIEAILKQKKEEEKHLQ